MDSEVKKVIAKVLKANPTLEEIEKYMSRHSMFNAIYEAAEQKLKRFEESQNEEALSDSSKFQPDNRDLFQRNVEYGFWNRDQLEVAEAVALKDYGEGFMGEANMDDSSISARSIRELLTVSKGGSVCMAAHDNVGQVSKANMIRKALECDYQKATEFELFWKVLEISPFQGINMIKNGTKFDGVVRKFDGIQQAWEYFNTLASELDAITPDKLKANRGEMESAPTVAYHLQCEVNEKPWKPKKKLQAMINQMEKSSYAQLKQFGSKMVKHRFPTWHEGSIFWSEYKKLKREKDPCPYHTRLGKMLINRMRKDPNVNLSKLRSLLFQHGKKGTGRLNEKDLSKLWAMVKAAKPVAEVAPVGIYNPADYPEVEED